MSYMCYLMSTSDLTLISRTEHFVSDWDHPNADHSYFVTLYLDSDGIYYQQTFDWMEPTPLELIVMMDPSSLA